jgi:serine protease AprX
VTELPRGTIEDLMFGTGRLRRFTQDSPILPDVWLEYAKQPKAPEASDPPLTETTDPGASHPPVRLLLTPFGESSTGDIARKLRNRLEEERARPEWQRFGHNPNHRPRVVYSQATVAAELYFEDLIRIVLPMTDWWQRTVGKQLPETDWLKAIKNPEQPYKTTDGKKRIAPELLWMIRVAGALAINHSGQELPQSMQRGVSHATDEAWSEILAAARALTANLTPAAPMPRIYSISLNREAGTTVTRSMLAVKADAARRVFDIKCNELAWAVVDTGIDACHPAFRQRARDGTLLPDPFIDAEGQPGNGTRIRATYDFTGVRLLLDPYDREELPERLQRRIENDPRLAVKLEKLYSDVEEGRPLDWTSLGPLLLVPHTRSEYYAPQHDHGTHVAGILAGDWRTKDDPTESLEADLTGVCPDLWLYDLRVLDDQGRGDEFAVMTAMQFLRHLNGANDFVSLHGANLSLSIPHDVANYACGRTPICDECERVVSAGIVVVAAAGNQGYRRSTTADGVTTEVYSSISITDPGNAAEVITVGATHRFRPHMYGVSYFSSRGPTGDGRSKPDLVAPGEKITAPIPNESYGIKDGTSMAAPHVSGAAALLMARHNELVGRPGRIKQILTSTATDLGRERYFQGAGMIDVLRALQSV